MEGFLWNLGHNPLPPMGLRGPTTMVSWTLGWYPTPPNISAPFFLLKRGSSIVSPEVKGDLLSHQLKNQRFIH